MDSDDESFEFFSNQLADVEKCPISKPSVIVIGAGISGIAAARELLDASYEVLLLESRDRLGGRIHTDDSFGCPIDMGASWLHGACNDNPLYPLIENLGLLLYRTSGDNSVLYDHDLESYTLFDTAGYKIPKELVIEAGDALKRILNETGKVRKQYSKDMSVCQAISIVLERHPNLRQEGVAHRILQWYICRMEAWFAADLDMISLKNWDQEDVISGGHGILVDGYEPLIKDLAKNLDVRLNHRVTKISSKGNKVVVTVENGKKFVADATIVTVPVGVLKANLIKFEPELPDWKTDAIRNIGFGNENKIALLFATVFWPNVDMLGTVALTSYACGYFLNLHKTTLHPPVLVYMAAGRNASDLEKLSDESAVEFVMLQLKKIFPDATDPIRYLVSRWGVDRDALGCYSYDLVGKAGDIYDKLREPVGNNNIYFGGEAASMEHQGSVHGAYSAGIMAAQSCAKRLMTVQGHVSVAARSPDIAETADPLQISRM